jgi:hypothetical protein
MSYFDGSLENSTMMKTAFEALQIVLPGEWLFEFLDWDVRAQGANSFGPEKVLFEKGSSYPILMNEGIRIYSKIPMVIPVFIGGDMARWHKPFPVHLWITPLHVLVEFLHGFYDPSWIRANYEKANRGTIHEWSMYHLQDAGEEWLISDPPRYPIVSYKLQYHLYKMGTQAYLPRHREWMSK